MQAKNDTTTIAQLTYKTPLKLRWITLLGTMICLVFAVLMSQTKHYLFGHTYMIVGSLYVGSVFFLTLFNHKPYIKNLLRIYAFPIDLVLLLSPVISALTSINISIAIAVMISLIITFHLPELTGMSFPDYTLLYVGATLIAIVLTTFADKLIKLQQYIANKEYRAFSQALALRMADQRKFKYLIYLMYFVALMYFNIAPALNLSSLPDPNFSTAIVQSFATYLAYERLVSNTHLLKKNSPKI